MMKFNYLLTALAIILSTALSAQFTIQIDLTTDDFPMETTWSLTDVNGEIAAEGPLEDANTLHEYVYDVAEGDYTFEIIDDFGDGICCGFGQGSYVLSEVTSGLVISQDGEFGEGATIGFSLPYVPPITGCTDPEALNYNSEAEVDDGACEYLVNQLSVGLIEVADGFQSIVDIANAGDDRLFVVEQNGTIKILNSDFTTVPGNFLNITSLTDGGGEQGLLGLAFHPDYADNGYFFVHYTNNNGTSVIARYTVSSADPNSADASSAEIILEQSQPFSNHNAGDINFGPDGYLYIPMGDGGAGGDPDNRAQNTETLLGKMLRIDVDGGSPYAIPADNPFVGVSTHLPEIWAIGLRNVWRFSFDAETGDMWMGDVGQNVWEEVDFEPAGSAGGLNYGWRCTEGLVDFNQSQCSPTLEITDPIAVYNHSGGACSITGGYVYRGSSYPEMLGKYFYTDYCNGQFGWIEQSDAGEWIQEEFLGPQGFGYSTFGVDVNNELYVANIINGTIYRLEDECEGLEASITLDGNLLISSEADSYVWLLDGEIIPDATDQTYNVDGVGAYSVVIGNGTGCTVESEPFLVTGIDGIDASAFSMAPNPASDFVQLKIENNELIEQINVFSIDGQKVISENYVNSNLVQIDVRALPQGIYVLELTTNKGSERLNFVIER